MRPQQRSPRRKRKSEARGVYKLRVWFIVHSLPNAWTSFSTARQDRNNNAFVRSLRDRIEHGEWKGKVNWAMFYHNGEPFLQYTDAKPTWHAPPKD
ncbi:MAG: hypothetical protein AAF840_06615 [Bacteroidota bacterium]